MDKFDPEGSGYDMESALHLIKEFPLTIPKPSKYMGDVIRNEGAFEAWQWHPEVNDYLKHQASRDPNTGLLLKGRKHKTWPLTVQGETDAGYQIIFKDGRYYSVPSNTQTDQIKQMNDALLRLGIGK